MTTRDVTVRFGGDAAGATKAARDTAEALDKVADSADDSQAQIRKLAEALGVSEDRAAALVSETRETVQSTSRLTSSARDLARSMGLSEAETRQFVRALRQADDAVEDVAVSADKTGGALSRLEGAAKTAIAAFGAQEILRFAGETLRASAELEDSIGAVDAIFGSAGEKIAEFGETSAESAGLAESAWNQASAQLGNSLQNAGLSAEQAADMTVRLGQRAADVAALMGTDVAEALDAVQASLRGEFDPIEKFTGGMSAAAVEAKALELGLVGSAAEMDNTAKVAATLELFFERTARAQGQFAREAGNLGGQLKIAQASTEDLKAEIGEQLAPAALDVLEAFKELAPVIADNIGEVASLTRELKPLIDALSLLGVIGDETGDTVDRLTERQSLLQQQMNNSQFGALIRARELFMDYRDAIDEVEERNEALGNSYKAVAQKVDDYRDAAERMGREALTETASAVQIVTQEFRSYERSLYDVITAQAALADPALGAASAINRLEDAQKAYEDTVKDSDATAEDRERAALDLAEAQNGLTVALARLKTEGGEDAISALQEILETAGVADDTIRRLIEAFIEYNALQVVPKNVGVVTGDGRRVSTRTGQYEARAGGGPAGGIVQVGEAGPEIVELPEGSYVHSASDSRRMLTGTRSSSAASPAPAGGVVIHRLDLHVHMEGTVNWDDPNVARRLGRRIFEEFDAIRRGAS